MLSVLNHYAHGYVAIPVILASRRRGLFESWPEGQPVGFTQLAARLGANPGPLRAALRMFEALGWISRVGGDAYALTAAAAEHREIIDRADRFLSFPFADYLDADPKVASLRDEFTASAARWGLTRDLLADFVDGVILIPLLLALRERGLSRARLWLGRAEETRREIGDLFVSKGWCARDGGGLRLTNVGEFVVDRVFTTATVASYKPMLLRIDEVLFGDCREVFQETPAGEGHVDRTFNVIASGFQHQKYFSDMERVVLSIFDRDPLSAQPRYIADTGCGDGTLLKGLYDVIRARTRRGAALDRHPLRLIGIDANDAALRATERTLQGTDHLVIKGDIGRPGDIIAELARRGITDPENILHVRSFLDHDRPYIPAADPSAGAALLAADPTGADREGREIPAGHVYASLKDHLSRWSSVMSRHGLLILEVHCLDPRVAARHMESESFHFDAYHAFSGQLLVKADRFLMAAAEVGLFPSPGSFGKYPRTQDFTRITLMQIQPRPYTIRHPRAEDVPALLDLEARCAAPGLRTPAGAVERRVIERGDGQLVVELAGEIVGVAYTQRIAGVEALAGASADDVDRLHDPEGPVVQLLGLNVDPDAQNRRIGDELLEFALQRASLLSGVRRVAGVSRFKRYARAGGMTPEAYLALRGPDGAHVDPILRFHEAHGAHVRRLVPRYRPHDVDNEGYGVLIEYDIHDRRPRPGVAPADEPVDAVPEAREAPRAAAAHHAAPGAAEHVCRLVRSLLRAPADAPLDRSQPLMEMGLDSADLLELSDRLSADFGLDLAPTFLFENDTCERIAAYFAQHAGKATAEAATPDRVRSRVVEMVSALAGAAREGGPPWAVDQPLVDIGLDSADLLELGERIASEFRVPVPPTFFFDHPTCGAVIAHLQGALGVPAAPDRAPAAAPDRSVAAAPDRERRGGARDVAVIGWACRLPSSITTPDQLWDLLVNGRDAIGAVPQDRWTWPREIDPAGAHRGIDRGAFLDDVARFDAGFFRISPKEAELMDPQQRLLLEVSWECLEDAGYAPQSLRGSATGVYVGASGSDYRWRMTHSPAGVEAHLGIGTAVSVLPNRLSYVYDLRGPSVLVDTACSSSLVALHEAMEALRGGRCAQALVAGVHVMCDPANTIAYYKAGMLAKDGRCKTFDASADGYVRGEGVIALLLKPLPLAERDGDRILGVLKGSAVNHGGQASGLTVPSPARQAEVVRQALADAGVEPETIDYVEAHGTGTSLGDPIEVEGLSRALRPPSGAARRRCAVGSVKPNIGHLEAAAGMAGVLKVLLMMRRATIPPLAHFKAQNPRILLDDAPLFIADRSAPWPQGGARRRAGVSSFGSGGTNAHVVIEDYEAAPAPRAPAGTPEVVVLSARSAERLRDQARRLLDALSARGLDAGLSDVAYTLQVGRDPMDHRLATTATSLDDLAHKLQRLLDGGLATADWHHGECARHADAFSALDGDDGMAQLARGWLARGAYAKILGLWVKGFPVEWAALRPANGARRVALPTYPFAGQPYWVREPPRAIVEIAGALHPLAQRNTSTFDEQRFSATFTGDEPFLRAHVVAGRRVLPAVAYLEMACAAIRLSRGDAPAGERPIRLTDVVWARPLVVDAPTDVHIALRIAGAGTISFEVYTKAREAVDRTVHASGRAFVFEASDAEAQAPIDLAAISTACDRSLSGASCYASFQARGLAYGAEHRVIDSVRLGARSALARIVHAPASEEGYLLHPSVMDGALQAALALALDSSPPADAPLPFSLEAIDVLAPAPSRAFAYVRRRADGHDALDVDVCDEAGRPCAQLRGYQSRSQGARSHRAPPMTLLAARSWRAAPARPGAAPTEVRWVLLDPVYEALAPALEARRPAVSWEVLPAIGGDVDAWFTALAAWAIERVRRAVGALHQGAARMQIVLASGGGAPAFSSALAALLRTAAREHPRFDFQIIDLSGAASAEALLHAIDEDAASPDDRDIRHRRGVREVACLEEITDVASGARPPWKEGGVYLVTGGAGGLGRLLAQEIAAHTKVARVVLTGRSALSESAEGALSALGRGDVRIEYRRVDVADEAAVAALIREICADHGSLDGVIHGAGVLRDSFLSRKTADEIEAVLAPKVRGAVNLDRATAHLPLDLFVLFSSVAAAFGNVGQADYALANAFLDRFAEHRAGEVAAGRRSGRTLAIAWPLWGAGGMQLPEAARWNMEARGLRALSSAEGFAALYRACASGLPHVIVVSGEPEAARRALLDAARVEPAPSVAGTPDAADGGRLRAAAERRVQKAVAAVLKLPLAALSDDPPLEQFGLDSILALQIVEALERDFGPLTKTLLFEQPTLGELTAYFLENHRARLEQLEGAAAPAAREPAAAPPRDGGRLAAAPPPRDRTRAGAAPQALPGIAIIGVSGRYPGARDIDALWENLVRGEDCVTEIPAERWDHAPYFDPDKEARGKTYCKWGGFLEGVDEFDPLFFNISPREAKGIDPQERLFLQCAYEAIEDAGYTRESLSSARGAAANVGVFVGVMYEEYQLYGAQAQAMGRRFTLSSSAASVANRVSYFCNFRGPSVAVDTMCSSSLTSIHLACQSLALGECEAAIAGGVNLSLHPNKYLMLAQGRFASSTGRCESFGEGGDGYVPGEGVGAVLLKPLAKALEDGDHIYGVIRATSVNHGGKTNGYTVPNPGAQAEVVARALAAAGVDPRAVSYVEAHGTGTSLGDPIEIAGLTKALGARPPDAAPCAIGSIKSNIGHCESAAGVAGLTKVLLQMKHATLVPSLHSAVRNRHIDFDRSPFRVQQEVAPWRRPVIVVGGRAEEHPRIAGVSSFGAGGANAHLIVEEPPAGARAAAAAPARPALILLSARTEDQLRERARRLRVALARPGLTDADLRDVAYTLQVGREAMAVRLALAATTLADADAKLARYADGDREVEGLHLGDARIHRDVFVTLSEDDAIESRAERWLDEGRADKVLELWVKGLTVDWRRLHANDSPRRVPLPAYPFARERCWFDEGEGDEAARAAPAREERVLVKRWRPFEEAAGGRPPRRVVLTTGPGCEDLARRLAEALPESEVLAEAPRSMDLLSAVDAWIDLAGCGRDPGHGAAWIEPLRSWIAAGPPEGAVALCVTRGLETCDGAPVRLAAADRVGLYRAIAAEHPRIHARHVDLDPAADDVTAAAQIAAELAGRDPEVEVRYREGRRQRAILEEVSLDAGVPPRVARDHAVLITGGTRGLGYLCARHMVRAWGVKRLVLTGREELPPREAWADRSRLGDAIARKIADIQALEAEGAEVHVRALPLGDEAELRRQLAALRDAAGPIAGVVHCAGVVDHEHPAFVRKSQASIARVLDPKVVGLDHLIRAVEGDPIQFFVLFSSVSAAVPRLAVGQSDYAAANAYMDYVAEAYRASLPITSIQWPSWKETGMGEVRSAVYRDLGFHSHTSAEGLRLLDRIMGARAAVVLPAIVDPSRWRPASLLDPRPDRSAPIAAPDRARAITEAPSQSPAPAAGAPPWLVAVAAAELDVDASRIDTGAPLQDYGADSVLLLQIVRRVGERLGVEIDPSVVYEHPTLASFGRWLAERYGGAVARAGAAETPPAARESDRPLPAPVAAPPQRGGDVAVIGLACRLPGAPDLDAYWALLTRGETAIRAVPPERWGRPSRYHAALLAGEARLDPEIFGISRADARAMDPQALLLLEESLALCYHAGYAPHDLKGARVGVYVGGRAQDADPSPDLGALDNLAMVLGQNYLAANVSRFFDLRGPSVVVDTACSSSLVAMSLAIQAIQNGDVDSAFVGGVSLLTSARPLEIFERRGILNPDPAFHVFDRRARGATLGEGCAFVWLKPLDHALRDGDRVYAVVKGIAVNNDGRTAGAAAPNPSALRMVMEEALRRSGKRPEEIAYVDVNGSGSEVTDLIELKAIQAVYRAESAAPCELGSMKPNIGHPLAAEGIASFVKSVLMLHHGRTMPFLSAVEPMKHYDWAASPFVFSRTAGEPGRGPTAAAVNSFGDGGTNASAVLEAWRPREATIARRAPIAPPAPKKIDPREPTPVRLPAPCFWDEHTPPRAALENGASARTIPEGYTP